MSSDDTPTSSNPGKGKKGADISEKLLKSLKRDVGAGTTNWLADLTQSALDEEPAVEEPATYTTATKRAGSQLEIVPMVDKLFDMFTSYIFEFNKSVAGSAMTVNCERPVPTKEGDARFGQHGGAAFQGRLSMHSWSLIVRGEADRVHCVLLPSDQLFAFNAAPNDGVYGRCCIIDSLDRAGQPGWNIAGAPLSMEELSTLAKQLLARLVKVVKGEVDPLAPFDWMGTGAAASMDTSGQFNKTVRGIDVTEQSLPRRPKSFDEDADPIFTAISQKGDRSASKEFAIAKPAEKPEAVEPAAAPAAAPAPATVSDAFSALEKAIDFELDVISKAGASAFAAKDLEAAELSLKQTGEVKQFRERVRALKREWDESLS